MILRGFMEIFKYFSVLKNKWLDCWRCKENLRGKLYLNEYLKFGWEN